MLFEFQHWIIFNALIVILLALDLFVFHKKAHKISMKEALLWCVFWESLAISFNIFIYYTRGFDDAIDFTTGYLIEKSLSLDNLFVFLLIFKYFHTPEKSLHKVLFWGVLGAIVMRAIFIVLGIAIISRFHWTIYLIGAFLIYIGVKLGLEKEKEIHPETNPLLILVRRFISVTNEYVDEKFFVIKDSKTYATPLFIVLIAIETTDVIFAIDSIPAILAITFDPFIVYTSNIFAILGLRSFYFVLQKMMSLFHYLHYGLAFILVFIGFKMLLAGFIKIPTLVALGVIFVVLSICVILSILYPKTPKEIIPNKHK